MAAIVLYDGTCGLCHKSVKWILKHEHDHELRFAPLQGETAAALRTEHPEIPALVDTVVLVEGGRARLRSKAVLYLARHLRAPWRWLYRVRWLPGFILDLGYRVVAKIRYRIWGRADACELPSPEQRARFLP
ncbi:MAG TPA: DCC1-like thiol-disulfide oxidoreductase family protein [Kofleriaceae bacterium]